MPDSSPRHTGSSRLADNLRPPRSPHILAHSRPHDKSGHPLRNLHCRRGHRLGICHRYIQTRLDRYNQRSLGTPHTPDRRHHRRRTGQRHRIRHCLQDHTPHRDRRHIHQPPWRYNLRLLGRRRSYCRCPRRGRMVSHRHTPSYRPDHIGCMYSQYKRGCPAHNRYCPGRTHSYLPRQPLSRTVRLPDTRCYQQDHMPYSRHRYTDRLQRGIASPSGSRRTQFPHYQGLSKQERQGHSLRS